MVWIYKDQAISSNSKIWKHLDPKVPQKNLLETIALKLNNFQVHWIKIK